MRRLQQPKSIGVLFEEHAAQGNAMAWSFDRPMDPWGIGPRNCSTAELADAVEEAAGWLDAAGVEPWDVVAIAKRNGFDYVLLACAAARLGAIPAQLAGQHPPDIARQLLTRLDQPTLLADDETLRGWEQADVPLTRVVRRVVALDATEQPGAVAVADLRGGRRAKTVLRRADEPMIITHTSGTTGCPKLVRHSARTIIGHLSRSEATRWPVIGTGGHDSQAACISWAHGRSITWTVAALRLQPRRVTPFGDPRLEATTATLTHARPTILETHPNMYHHWEELLDDERRKLFANVRVYYNTFDAAHPRAIRRFLHASRRRLPVWIQGWGQTECGPLTGAIYTRRTFARHGDADRGARNVGRSIPWLSRVRAVDPTSGRPVPNGERGLLMARTPGRCIGYVGEDRRFFEKISGRWWNTGDVGSVDRLGIVQLFDREVDQLDEGSCLVMEDTLLDRLSETTEVVVLAVPDGLPQPVVCLKSESPLSAADWESATAGLPPMQLPIQLKWNEVPRTSTWKVQRSLLRKQVLGTGATVGSGRWT